MRNRILGLLLLVAVALPLAGCGKGYDGAKRYAISGTVKYNGEPIKEGTIEFSLTDNETQDFAPSTPIADGKFVLEERFGPNLGQYKIEIFAFEPIDPNADPDDADAADRTQNVIPKKYNADTTLTLDIKEDQLVYDLDLPE